MKYCPVNYLKSMSVIVCFTLFIFAYFVYENSRQAITAQTDIATLMNVEERTDHALAILLKKLSFSLYEGADEYEKQIASLQELATDHQNLATVFTLLFFTLALCWITFLFLKLSNQSNKILLWKNCLIICLLCLLVGVFAPMMQMTAYKEVPMIGNVIFKYQAKSIFSTVQSLLGNGNFIVAVLIALFSVITPLAKMLVITINLFAVKPALHHRANHWIHLLGKWSMADVFIVAIMLSIFALDTQGFTQANTEIGVYFFAAYCLLSLLITHNVLKESLLELTH